MEMIEKSIINQTVKKRDGLRRVSKKKYANIDAADEKVLIYSLTVCRKSISYFCCIFRKIYFEITMK